jgi:hypothetical protein
MGEKSVSGLLAFENIIGTVGRTPTVHLNPRKSYPPSNDREYQDRSRSGQPILKAVRSSLCCQNLPHLIPFGPELILTPPQSETDEAVKLVRNVVTENLNIHVNLDQFSNFANPPVHDHTTAVEIWEESEYSGN